MQVRKTESGVFDLESFKEQGGGKGFFYFKILTPGVEASLVGKYSFITALAPCTVDQMAPCTVRRTVRRSELSHSVLRKLSEPSQLSHPDSTQIMTEHSHKKKLKELIHSHKKKLKQLIIHPLRTHNLLPR